MSKPSKRLLALAVSAACLAPATALATNGYFSHGYGTHSKGLAGAGAALPMSSMDAATNPANMVHVGDRLDLGAALFSPQREYTVEGMPSGPPAVGLAPGNVESDSDYFLIPHIGWNKMLNDESSVGITVYGNGGMNTDYPDDVAGSGQATFGGPIGAGVNLEQLFVNGSYARKINEKASWGIGVIAAYQRFKATGLGAFAGMNMSSDPANLTDNGHDDSFGFGARLGVQGEVAPGLRLAASYQTEMSMDEFDKYKGLFAEQGGFDIPASAVIGLAFDVTPASTLVFDIQKIWYSDVASIANPLASPGQLGDDDGAGFGWDDMTVYKLGYQWATSDDMTWRVGVSTGDQPIASSEVLFNILAPAVMEEHLTFGFTKAVGTSNEFNFAAMYAPKSSVSGPNPMDPAQTIELEMVQYELEASYTWKF